MKILKKTNNLLALTIVMLLLSIIIVIGISYVQSREVNRSAKLVSHTQEVLYNSEKVVTHCLEIESSVRGYVLTGKTIFIDSLNNAEVQLYKYLTRLKQLTKDKIEQQQRIDSLTFYIKKRIERSNIIKYLMENSGRDYAFKVMATGEGKKISEQIGRINDQIQSTEYFLLEKRKQETERAVLFQKLILFSALIIIVALTIFSVKKIRDDLLEKRFMLNEISKLNEGLEIKVQERTQELERSNKTLEETFLRITDAFSAFDKNWCYTYANKQVGEMVHLDPAYLIGKNVWEIFPDAVGSATYVTMHKAMEEQKYMWNEDYYAPLDLWQENHIYPSPEGVSVFIRNISEKKRKEKELAESNLRYELVTKATSDAIWDWDITHDSVYWGEGFHTIFGYTIQDLGTDISIWNTLIHPADQDRVLKKIMAALESTDTKWKDEYRYKKADGNYAFVSDAAMIIRDESGKAVRMMGAVQDITEKKKLEALPDKATTLSRIGGWEIDMKNNTVYFSDMTKEIHEVDKDFVPDIATGINFYKEGKNRETITRIIQEAIEKGTPWDTELEIITAKGNECWVRAMGEAEFEDGKCIRLFGSFQDINKFKNVELAFAQALEEKANILESIGDAFFAVGKDRIVTYWNKHAEKLTKRKRDDVIGKPLSHLFNDSIECPFNKYYPIAFNENKVQHFEIYSEKLKAWIEISAYSSAGGLSVYFKNITERINAEMKLNELNDNLEKHAKELAVSNKELEQFAYVASHDLQEPLRMVTSFLSQLEKKYKDVIDDKGKQYIHFAVDGARRMRQIILDLLEFSRIGRREDKLEDVDLNEVITDTLSLFKKQIEETGALIKAEKLPVIHTFKSPVRQVFQNLVSNSLKYQKKGIPPEITISSKETANEWQFSVADNGIGIDPQYFEKIFIIFQRLHNKDEYSGTGMGLAIIKKIVEGMGGKIWVESAEDQGATFYFSIPKHIKTES